MQSFYNFYYNKLTEMPHSNRTHFDYEIENFSPKEHNKREKFEELVKYIIDLTAKDGRTVYSKLHDYKFVSDGKYGSLAHNDFLKDNILIYNILNWFGDYISPNIRSGKIPLTKRTKKEIEDYQRWINELVGENTSEFLENKNINTINN